MTTMELEAIRTWKTGEGEELPISGMTTGHIRNCIDLIDMGGRVFDSFWDEDNIQELQHEVASLRDYRDCLQYRWLHEELESRAIQQSNEP